MVDRKFHLPAAELLDRLSINQIKEMLFEDNESVTREISDISHDLDLLISENKINLDSRFLRVIIVLSQINVHVWYMKDQMQKDSERYDELLRLAHQINGIRNKMKNILLEEFGDKEKSLVRSNFNTDSLVGWDVSI